MPTPSADATKANVPSDRETALLYNTGCPGPRRSSAHSHEGRSVQTPRAGSHEGKWAGSSFSEGIEYSRGEARPMRMPIMHFTTPVTTRRARWKETPHDCNSTRWEETPHDYEFRLQRPMWQQRPRSQQTSHKRATRGVA